MVLRGRKRKKLAEAWHSHRFAFYRGHRSRILQGLRRPVAPSHIVIPSPQGNSCCHSQLTRTNAVRNEDKLKLCGPETAVSLYINPPRIGCRPYLIGFRPPA